LSARSVRSDQKVRRSASYYTPRYLATKTGVHDVTRFNADGSDTT
jgi:hypothetical protein